MSSSAVASVSESVLTVAVQASAFTELKLRISVASNGLMIDMLKLPV